MKKNTTHLEALFKIVSLDGDKYGFPKEKRWKMQDYSKIRPWINGRPMSNEEWQEWKKLDCGTSGLIMEMFKNGRKVAEQELDNMDMREILLLMELQDMIGRKWSIKRKEVLQK